MKTFTNINMSSFILLLSTIVHHIDNSSPKTNWGMFYVHCLQLCMHGLNLLRDKAMHLHLINVLCTKIDGIFYHYESWTKTSQLQIFEHIFFLWMITYIFVMNDYRLCPWADYAQHRVLMFFLRMWWLGMGMVIK